jgi:hypothetical protein
MENYAHITNSVVDNIIIADADFIASLLNASEYVLSTDSVGIGYNYKGSTFYPPAPYPSWTLDSNFVWQPPIPIPNDGKNYRWDETILNWKIVVPKVSTITTNTA